MNRTSEHVLSLAASDPALAQLCDELIERLQSGEDVDIASLALQHPEYAEQLQRLVPAFEALVDLGATAARQPVQAIANHGMAELAPRVLGDYRIVREIGRGGMGVVYEAEQRSLNRRVALKVLPMAAALDARQFQRFQLEAQAAACLHHNNIVPVFAVGTEGGVPFYAMQFIEGRSLAEVIQELRRADGLNEEPPPHVCEAGPRLADLSTTALARSLVSGQAPTRHADGPTEPHGTVPPGEAQDQVPVGRKPSKVASSTRTRDYCRNVARLGLQAAEALDHAHTRGILHRDIKPANLLLDAEGRLWVTDFGLAQIQGNHGLTLSGDILGTLRYMSPEQALARRVVIDGRTDVYSLGVTLYELLTLQPAFDGKDRTEILRKIESDEPTSLRKLNASVPQDLETIVLKAMAKEAAGRYATAQELAADLKNFLEDRPIRARRPGLLDRAARWSRRHRPVVTTSALLLALGTAVSVWQAVKAKEAAAEAAQRADELRQVVEYLARDVFSATAAGKRSARSLTVGELLDRADATLGERFRDRPLVEASVRMALADSFGVLLDLRRAMQNATRAAQIRERYYGLEHPQTLEALGRQSYILSWTEPGSEQWNQKLRAAESMARRILDFNRRVLGLAHSDTLLIQNVLARIVSRLGRPVEAEGLAAQALDLAVRFLGPEHWIALQSEDVLASIARLQGNLARSETLLRHAVEGGERGYGPLQGATITALHDLADVIRQQGRREESLRLHLEAVNRNAQVYGLPHVQTSSPMGHLFDLLTEKRDYAAIRDLCEGWIRELLDMPPEPDRHGRYRCSVRLSGLALRLAMLPEPVPFDAALAVQAAERAAALDGDWDDAWTVVGVLYYRTGQIDKAMQAIQTSMARPRWKGGDDFDWLMLALIHARRGEPDQARVWYDKARNRKDPVDFNRDDLRPLCEEAAALLGLADSPADAFAQP
jgi:serine/threonine protein kinase